MFFLLKQIIIVSPFFHIVAIISQFAAELEEPRIGICCKGLMQLQKVGEPGQPASTGVGYSPRLAN